MTQPAVCHPAGTTVGHDLVMSVLRELPSIPSATAATADHRWYVDVDQVEQIRKQLALLKAARPQRRPRIARPLQTAAIVIFGCFIVTLTVQYVTRVYLSVLIALVVEVASLLGLLLWFAAAEAIRAARLGPMDDYAIRGDCIPLEAQFVNAVVAYDEPALRFAERETAWLAKRQGRAAGAALSVIWYPALLLSLSALFTPTPFLPPAFPHQAIIFIVLLIGVFNVYGLGRMGDVEHLDRYEHLLAQAADLSAIRAQGEPAEWTRGPGGASRPRPGARRSARRP
jgi:hypothetical protein